MSYKSFLLGLIATFVGILGPQWTLAGGGPENVCLVVNADSPDSMAIANHYMQLRHIPPSNVVYLSLEPETNDISIDEFRRRILRPVLETLIERKLDPQIDYIVYSSDFPWLIDFNKYVQGRLKHVPRQKRSEAKWPKVLGRRGSLTGLTYLYSRVMSKGLSFVSLRANRYMRPVLDGRQTAPTMGFRGVLQFDESGQPVASGGERYLLSAVLAVTPTEKRRGMSAKQAMAYLSRSAKVDGTHPQGKIFFTLTKDIRTTKRAEGFPFVRDALHELGIPTEVITTNMPMGKNNVLGLTSGTARFSWDKTGSTILPGAICDNLTSSGGRMLVTGSQTAMTEFLRHGAAGASGTVIEPFLRLEKFPNPMIHAHYARGCSLAEAFYQSIHSPYQQLIAGDPLCQPFAQIPRVRVPEIKPRQRVQGTLTLRPEATIPPKVRARDPNARVSATEQPAGDTLAEDKSADPIDHFELFVDGVRHQTAKPGEPLSLDTTKLGDGYHELRVVAVGPAPISTQGRKIVWIETANHGHTIRATTPSRKVPLDGTLAITAKSPRARRIEVRHNGRIVGTAYGTLGTAKFKASRLGRGFNYVQVVGIHGDEPKDKVYAMPIVLWVE